MNELNVQDIDCECSNVPYMLCENVQIIIIQNVH